MMETVITAAEETILGNFKYHTVSMEESSAKYGDCEVCGEPCSEVFHQVESRKFLDAEGKEQYTYHMCHNIFGHESCLMRIRRRQ